VTERLNATFDVRIWETLKYEGASITSYTVRWVVAGRKRRRPCRTAAHAETFRSQLIAAARQGEPFDIDSGLPLSLIRREVPTTSWYQFACSYVDMKWPAASPKHRKSIAEALVTATPVMLDTKLHPVTAKAVRSALLNWGFTARRDSPDQPAEVTEHLNWVARHSRPVVELARPEVARRALEALATKLDGARASGRTTTVKRANLSGALGYAVEIGLLDSNPLKAIKWKSPKSTTGVDRRVVINHQQAEQLLGAVAGTPRRGEHLVAFFACMYYSALRPEEAVNVRANWLALPDGDGWGWMTLDGATPETDKQWTDTGQRRGARELKHRALGETRRVPVPPELVRLLRQHLATFGTDSDGRLFRGERGASLAGITYRHMWDRARKAALTAEQYDSPLARRPYDLRHAAVSTWLNSGVSPSRVAEWAGHSIDVLLKIYAKCIDGQEQADLQRLDARIGRTREN
jgi:integrase